MKFKTLLKEVLSIPSASCHEERMREFIFDFAAKNGIACKSDKKGNVYLTKGMIKVGEYCPCMIEHLDTVQKWQLEFAEENRRIPIEEVKTKDGRTKLRVDKKIGGGVGADDKAGIAIALALMLKFEKCKAVFCVEEEIGMKGSAEMDYGFLSNASICVTTDNPGRLTSATRGKNARRNMYCQSFFDTILKPVCIKHHLKSFNHKASTDICNVMRRTKLVCWDLCNGGYKPHSREEYVIVEDAELSYKLLVDLFKKLKKNTQYVMPNGGMYESINHDLDKKKVFTCGCWGYHLKGAPYGDKGTVVDWMEKHIGPVTHTSDIDYCDKPFVMMNGIQLEVGEVWSRSKTETITTREIAQGCADDVKDMLCIAEENKDPEILFELHNRYLYGRGVEADSDKEDKYLRLAAELGHEEANQRLEWKRQLMKELQENAVKDSKSEEMTKEQ